MVTIENGHYRPIAHQDTRPKRLARLGSPISKPRVARAEDLPFIWPRHSFFPAQDCRFIDRPHFGPLGAGWYQRLMWWNWFFWASGTSGRILDAKLLLCKMASRWRGTSRHRTVSSLQFLVPSRLNPTAMVCMQHPKLSYCTYCTLVTPRHSAIPPAGLKSV